MSEDEFMCPICHENNDLPKFTLPECQHEFHCECIMHWFRAGNTRCPMCNNRGHVQDMNEDYYPSYRYSFRSKSNFLRKYANRKDGDPLLKQYVSKIRNYELKLKELNAEIREHRDNFVGNYKECLKINGSYSAKKRRINQSINKIKREMCEYPIKELIIVRKITLMDD